MSSVFPNTVKYFFSKYFWKYYRVESIAISSITFRNNNNLSKLIQRINISSAHLCKAHGFDFVGNDRIGKNLLWRDDLHVTDKAIPFLAIIFLNFFNSFRKYNILSDWQPNKS